MRNLISGRPIMLFFFIFLATTCALLAFKASNAGRPADSASSPSQVQHAKAEDLGNAQRGQKKGLFLNLQPLDYDVLLTGNAILLLATLTSFYFYQRALRNNQVHAFMRSIYSGMLLKMTICLAAAFLYVFLARQLVSKITILGCFGLYLVYTFVEVTVLMQRSKLSKDA
jgi:hypothetical protein